MASIILICGIPGAGKSKLLTYLREFLVLPGVTKKIAISFDDYEDQKDTWTEATFREGRLKALGTVTNALRTANATSADGSTLILIDDNMYLHSMRRQIYTIASMHSAALVVIYVSIDPVLAWDRNSRRTEDRIVSQESFHNIVTRFEAPNDKYPADRFNIEIDGIVEPRIQEDLLARLVDLVSTANRALEAKIASTEHLIEAIHEPACEASIGGEANRLDADLRKKITRIISMATRDLANMQLPSKLLQIIIKSLSAACSRAKQQSLSAFKREAKALPIHVLNNGATVEASSIELNPTTNLASTKAIEVFCAHVLRDCRIAFESIDFADSLQSSATEYYENTFEIQKLHCLEQLEVIVSSVLFSI